MASDADTVRDVINLLAPLDDEARGSVLAAVAAYFNVRAPTIGAVATASVGGASRSGDGRPLFSEDRSATPKEFLLQKQPRTDVERIACLAYYVTHYRDMPHFKTTDLSQLNMEAAQPRLSNAAYTVNNAAKMGYLTSASRGAKQLSAAGEQFVLAMPDRDAARKAMERFRPRRRAGRRQETENQ